jgi:hypothetical protein
MLLLVFGKLLFFFIFGFAFVLSGQGAPICEFLVPPN